VIAREHGFPSWNALREHVEARSLSFAAAVDEFVRCATGDAAVAREASERLAGLVALARRLLALGGGAGTRSCRARRGPRWLLEHDAEAKLAWAESGEAPVHVAARRWDVAMVELLARQDAVRQRALARRDAGDARRARARRRRPRVSGSAGGPSHAHIAHSSTPLCPRGRELRGT